MSLTPEKMAEALESQKLSFYLTPASLQALNHFIQKMLEINESLNLTRWTEDEEVLNFHVLDSAWVLPTLKPLISSSARWVDLGTGCGFPGAVLMAAFPTMEMTLLDSVAKKTKALEECLKTTNFSGKTLTGRAEELGQDPRYREQYDGVVARAVADLAIVLEYALPLLRVGGYLVNWMTEEQIARSGSAQKALEILNAKIVQTVPYTLPGSTQARFYLLIQKTASTPPGYPRAVGIPSKHPL